MEFLYDFTPQLFYFPRYRELVDSRLKPEPIGSCVLVDINGESFLLTAKHTFQNVNLKDVSIFAGDRMITLGGDISYFLAEEESDPIDIAIVKLHPEMAKIVRRHFKFLPHQYLDLDHTFHNKYQYNFCGFINDLTEVVENSITPYRYSYVGRPNLEFKLEKNGYYRHSNIAIKFGRRNQRNLGDTFSTHGPKEYNGLSGCGLWHLQIENGKVCNINLVGIMIEQRLERGVLIATKLNVIKGLLDLRFGIQL